VRRARRTRLPMPRDLKEPAGWRFSSLRNMRQPAAMERAEDSIRGVEIQGLGSELHSMLTVSECAMVLEDFQKEEL